MHMLVKGLVRNTAMLLIIMVLIFITACSGNNGGAAIGGQTTDSPTTKQADGNEKETKADEKVKLKLAYGVGWSSPSMSPKDNPALKYVEDKLGVELDLTVLAGELYGEKLKVMIAGGDIPDAFSWGLDDFAVNLIESGAVVPLDDYIDQYPNLKAQKDLYPTNYKNKKWAISTVRNPIAASDIPLIRMDWLDNLKLKQPHTLEELYEVARAFTHDDPDDNGKQDTYGIQLTNSMFGWSLLGANGIEHIFGLHNDWVKVDGKYVPKIATDNYKQYLTWMSKAFNEGLIDRDFAVTDNPLAESKVVRKGQAGIFFHYTPRIYDFEANFQKEHPEARLSGFEAVKGPNGDQGVTARVNMGGMFISKQAADNPLKLKKILEWLDYGASQEGGIFWNYGVEDIHFTKDAAGKIVPDTKAFEKDMPRTFTFTLPVQSTDEVYVFPQYTTESQEAVISAHKLNEPHIKYNTTSYAFSETRTKYASEISDFLLTNMTQTIMGVKSVDQWDNVVDEFYQRFEGDKMAEEITQTMGD